MSLSDLLAPLPTELTAVRSWEAETLQDAPAPPGLDQQLEETEPPPPAEIPVPEPPPEQPETVLDAARAQAAALLRQAEEQAEQLRRDAIREGLRQGETEAAAACAAERARLQEVAGSIGAALTRHCEEQVPVLARLAALAAETLLMDQLSLEPERVLTVVRRALAQTLAGTSVTVYLHPEDLALIGETPDAGRQTPLTAADSAHASRQADLPTGGWRPASGVSIEWRPDASLERGGCRIESDQGEVDATLSGRLARFRETMLR